MNIACCNTMDGNRYIGWGYDYIDIDVGIEYFKFINFCWAWGGI